jgi:hypothetical protein
MIALAAEAPADVNSIGTNAPVSSDSTCWERTQ